MIHLQQIGASLPPSSKEPRLIMLLLLFSKKNTKLTSEKTDQLTIA